MTVIDAYDVSLRVSKTKLEAAQHEAAISRQERTELENEMFEMEKKLQVLHTNNEQQADMIETLQRKGIHKTKHNYYCCVYRTCTTRKNCLALMIRQ